MGRHETNAQNAECVVVVVLHNAEYLVASDGRGAAVGRGKSTSFYLSVEKTISRGA